MKFNWIVLVTVAVSHTAFAVEPPKHVPGRNAGRRAKERTEYKEHTINTKEFRKIIVKDGCLDESRQALLNRLNAGTEVPYNELTDQLIALHQKFGSEADPKLKMSYDELDTQLGKFRNTTERQDLQKIKDISENLLSGVMKHDLKYDAKSTSLIDLCLKGSCDAYAGTVFNQVTARKILSKSYEERNPVVIFEPGHVMSGFMLKEGEDYRLIGLSSSEKKGFRDFGLVKDLPADSKLKVVKSNSWLLGEIFKDCLKKPEVFANNLLSDASDEFGLAHIDSQDSIEKPEVVVAKAVPAIAPAVVPVDSESSRPPEPALPEEVKPAPAEPNEPWHPGKSPLRFGQNPLDIGTVERVESSKKRSEIPYENSNETYAIRRNEIIVKAAQPALTTLQNGIEAMAKKYSDIANAKNPLLNALEALSPVTKIVGEHLDQLKSKKQDQPIEVEIAPEADAEVVPVPVPVVDVKAAQAALTTIQNGIEAMAKKYSDIANAKKERQARREHLRVELEALSPVTIIVDKHLELLKPKKQDQPIEVKFAPEADAEAVPVPVPVVDAPKPENTQP